MYNLEQIRDIHLEVTSRCQARCPMCPRRMQGGPMMPFVTLDDINLETFKEWFPVSFIQQLDKVNMCGNLGDPIINTETLDIYKYFKYNSLLNNKSSVSSSSQNGSIGLDLPSISLQEIFVVAYYKDGSDNSFDNYNTLISGPGSSGQYRIMGEINSANWYSSSTTTLNDGGTFKNGVTSSTTTALPMPATLLRFTSSVARTETRGILYNTQVADRGWIGGVGEIIGLSATPSTSDRQKIEGYLANKWGLSLASGHPYGLSAPVSQTTWSAVQSFTTPTNVTVPVLGSLSTANLNTTTADLESTLTDNGNAATNLVFYWGDNDGGSNPSSWDSNFSIPNAQVGTLRKSLTGLTGGTTYYFRTYASNWKGNVWAGTTRSFTTVTSTMRDNPVRNSDLKGWWKLDGNLKDSSGNNLNADADFTFKPTDQPNLKLWLNASELSSSGTSWADKSGNGNNAAKTGSPAIISNFEKCE